jgi:hypothetical protein
VALQLEGRMRARLVKVMMWAPVTSAGLLDFATTTCLCVIIVGIVCACRYALTDPEYFAGLVQ